MLQRLQLLPERLPERDYFAGIPTGFADCLLDSLK
jgi:hypothetical protein